MINPDTEIDRLKNRLTHAGFSQGDIDRVVSAVRGEIDSIIFDLVDEAMIEATQIGESLGVPEFVDELKAMRRGSTYNITTDSGRTDFSTPPFPMLPGLLKNARPAKDGSLYKRIPITQRTKQDKQVQTNIFDIIDRTNKQQRELFQQRKIERDKIKQQGAFTDIMVFNQLNQTRSFVKEQRRINRQAEKADPKITTQFFTASSKQNPNTQWVRPAKNRDMQRILFDINTRLEDAIQAAITNIISSYEEAV